MVYDQLHKQTIAHIAEACFAECMYKPASKDDCDVKRWYMYDTCNL